jgi:SAM-dependent methyltransferase
MSVGGDEDALAGFDARATYGTAARDYADAARDFWVFAGRRTVERLGPLRGRSVLDVACGTGAATIPAAEAVGPSGRVLAVDYAETMLAIAREEARARGLAHVELRTADMTRLDTGGERFDVVVCALGVFFADDMAGLLRLLRGLVRPGGRLAVTVLGPGFFSPMLDCFRRSVRSVRPDVEVRPPWIRTEDPQTVRALLREAGLPDAEVTLERDTRPLASPEDWWRCVMGSALRSYVEEIGPAAAEEVRRLDLARVRSVPVREIGVDAIYAVARVPA